MREYFWVPLENSKSGGIKSENSGSSLIHLWKTRSCSEPCTVEVFDAFATQLSKSSVDLPLHQIECIDLRDYTPQVPLLAGLRFVLVVLNFPEGYHFRLQIREGERSFWPPSMQTVREGEKSYIPINYQKGFSHILAVANTDTETGTAKLRLLLEKRNPEVELRLAPLETMLIHLESEFLDHLAPFSYGQSIFARLSLVGSKGLSIQMLDYLGRSFNREMDGAHRTEKLETGQLARAAGV